MFIKDFFRKFLSPELREKLYYYRPSRWPARVDTWLGLMVDGNGAGFMHNRKGKAEIRAGKPWKGKVTEASRIMKEVGYASIGQPYDARLIETIRTKWAELIKDDEVALWQNPQTRQISRPEKNIPEVKALITEEILDYFRSYFGTEVKVHSVSCWRIFGVPDERREEYFFSNWWHFDSKPTSIAKIFISVSDVTERDGPFHIYSLAGSKHLIKKGYRNRYKYGGASSDIETWEGLYKMTGPAGTAVICNTELCLHRAGVPFEGHYRDMIQFQIVPSAEKMEANGDWFSDLTPKGVDHRSDRYKGAKIDKVAV